MGRRKVLNHILKPFGFQVLRLGDEYAYKELLRVLVNYKKDLVEKISEESNYIIVDGPFEGLRLPRYGAWSDLDIASKIIGAYEKELFPFIEDIIRRRPKFLINIGASEGYYAIGIKRRLPMTKCYTYDVDEKTFSILAECMSSNSVEVERLETFDYSNPLVDIDEKHPISGCFIFDCEGFEEEILKFPDPVSQSSIFLIELHEILRPGVTRGLTEYFKDTHNVTTIDQTDHSFGNYPQLKEYDTLQRTIVLDEHRGTHMQWLYAIPKSDQE